MGYKLIVTERTEELLDSLVSYLLLELGNEPAAVRLLDGMERIYSRLEQNPLQFPVSCDGYLAGKGYRMAVMPEMSYMVIFRVSGQTVVVLGIFHQLENVRERLL